MSSGQLARNRTLSLGSGHSSHGRAGVSADFSMASASPPRYFDPCAATASMFLYAQGTAVVCAHHDTLKIERVFARHTEDIELLAVDTVSERGAGRLVVSYDAGQTAIVWDLLTGDEIARFASYEHLSVAAWMRNGNVAFGNTQGNVILFEPSTSEHISARTIDQIPITSLAPAADCRTYAIGYQNGSCLIAALQPRFTILHNLTTSRAPSPIITLAWHASSSRQKSDMLATQTNDGDLRVWSVAKSPSSHDTAKVVRVLKRSENFQPGPNWLGWSKNGRIVQYSEGETSSWDVRTKHVTYESVPTLEHVRGLAVYGPGATLFTLGASNTLQQFDLNSPPVLVANVQHPANLLPPSPPVSIEEQKKGIVTASAADISVPINIDVSESDEDHMSPLARIAREMDKLEVQEKEQQQHGPDRSGALSPVSSRSQTSTNSMLSLGSRGMRKHASVLSRGQSDATSMSFGSLPMTSREPSVISSRDSLSQSSLSSRSHTSSHRPRPRASRLRQEVLLSPEERHVIDLFKFTKSRLSDILYTHPRILDNTRLTNDDLRRQMLSTIFGWDGEVTTLIQDEISRHPAGSPNRLLLAKWLGDIDTDIMATSSESMTSSDWMLLALSGIGGQASQQKVARAYVQRLLEKGDVHTAATIMIGMGDQNDAIEIYVSHKRYMEALILTCLVFPADWKRQTELVRKWGEWAVQHGQQQLAIRCFSCTGSESSEPWSSPSAQTATFSQSQVQSIPEVLSPPLSPPSFRGPQRDFAKTSALKLITSFGDAKGKSKFFGVGDGDRTPMGGGGITPIAESALSPGGADNAHTAFLRPSQRSVYNTPASARTATPGGFARQRLPSIGEMPTDVMPLTKADPPRLPTPADSGSDKEKSEGVVKGHERKSSHSDSLQLSAATYQPAGRAATASPMMQKTKLADGSAKNPNALPSPHLESFTALKQDARLRNGSRDRKPDGLQIQWPPMESIITGEYMTSPEPSLASSRRTPASHSMAGSVASERSYKSRGHASPVITGRSLDQYISSLESAQLHSQNQRSLQSSRDRHGRDRSSSRRPKAREPSEDRGRSNIRYIKPAKRSPTSPVPMSPEDLRDLGAVGYGNDITSPISEPRRTRDDSTATAKYASKPSSRVRRRSPEALPRLTISSKPSSRVSSRTRHHSPDGLLSAGGLRGRSKGRDGSVIRSPSSPLPMSPQAKFYQADDDDDDLRKAHEDQKRFRSRQRSASRLRERASSSVRNGSPERRRRDRSASRQPGSRSASKMRGGLEPSPLPRLEAGSTSHARTISDQKAGDLYRLKTERALKKEAAARELEERRKSLARRPSAPPIVHPEELQLSPIHQRSSSRGSPELLRSTTYPSPNSLPPRSQTASPGHQRTMSGHQRISPGTLRTSPSYLNQSANVTQPQVGLPATPRAMRHPKYDPEGRDIPDVPEIPESYNPGPISMGSLNQMSYNPSVESLTLPKTTYQAAPRHVPPRSMSAPIPEEPTSPMPLPAGLPTHPAFQAALPPSSRRKDSTSGRAPQFPPVRKINPGESQPGTIGYESRNNSPVYSVNPPTVMGGIDETIEANKSPLIPSNNNLTPPPPPPPPAPPILKELQHLAMPPPPPPAPLGPMYRNPNTNSITSGVSQGSGVIEIVMDGDEEAPPPVQVVEHSPPKSRSRTGSVSERPGHSRGRSFNDNSITGRFSRATERIRSASRGNTGSPIKNRQKSPTETSPYESIHPMWGTDAPPPLPKFSNNPASPLSTERHPMDVRNNYMEMEGGMI